MTVLPNNRVVTGFLINLNKPRRNVLPRRWRSVDPYRFITLKKFLQLRHQPAPPL